MQPVWFLVLAAGAITGWLTASLLEPTASDVNHRQTSGSDAEGSSGTMPAPRNLRLQDTLPNGDLVSQLHKAIADRELNTIQFLASVLAQSRPTLLAELAAGSEGDIGRAIVGGARMAYQARWEAPADEFVQYLRERNALSSFASLLLSVPFGRDIAETVGFAEECGLSAEAQWESICSAWARRDPQGTVKQIISGELQISDIVLSRLLDIAARNAPGKVIPLLAGNPGLADRIRPEWITDWTKTDAGECLSWLRQSRAQGMSDEALEQAYWKQLAMDDPRSAVRELADAGLPCPLETRMQALLGLLDIDPGLAMTDEVLNVATGGNERLNEILRGLVQNPDRLPEVFRSNQGDLPPVPPAVAERILEAASAFEPYERTDLLIAAASVLPELSAGKAWYDLLQSEGDQWEIPLESFHDTAAATAYAFALSTVSPPQAVEFVRELWAVSPAAALDSFPHVGRAAPLEASGMLLAQMAGNEALDSRLSKAINAIVPPLSAMDIATAADWAQRMGTGEAADAARLAVFSEIIQKDAAYASEWVGQWPDDVTKKKAIAELLNVIPPETTLYAEWQRQFESIPSTSLPTNQ